MQRVASLFLLGLLLSSSVASAQTYVFEGRPNTCLIVGMTVVESGVIEVDCVAKTVVIKDANSNVLEDPALDFRSIIPLDEAAKATVRARYLGTPFVSELVADGIAIDVAIERCKEQERLFMKQFQSCFDSWRDEQDVVAMMADLERLRDDFRSVVKMVGYEPEISLPYFIFQNHSCPKQPLS